MCHIDTRAPWLTRNADSAFNQFFKNAKKFAKNNIFEIVNSVSTQDKEENSDEVMIDGFLKVFISPFGQTNKKSLNPALL